MFSRVTFFDVTWAGVSPILAFLIRDGTINRIDQVAVYGGVSLAISLVVFQWFRISSPLTNYFSMHDVLTVSKACLTTVALTAVVLFIFTRLNYAPRSIPIIHFFVLGCGLIGARAWSRITDTRLARRNYQPRCEEIESILVIGATRLAWFFSMMVEELSSRDRRIVAIVDERPQLINRTLNGYSIVGSPEHLSEIIDEYATHGVEIRKVVAATHPNELTGKALDKLQATCNARNIPIEWLYKTLSISPLRTAKALETPVTDLNSAAAPTARTYWKIKRLIDVVAALAMLITFAPLAILVAILVLVDVGFPIVFWQQRIGYLGRPVRVYKFRTLRSAFDRKAQIIPMSERVTLLGRLLRGSHLDEIPQLFSILAGDMSLIGPRPLLPVDQPKNIGLRLHVRPGLTGLAQISGGTLLSADEKDVLDEWYIKQASLLLDIKIILRTTWVLIHGNPRDDAQISAALAERCINTEGVFE